MKAASYVNCSHYEFQFKDEKSEAQESAIFGTGHSMGWWKSQEKEVSLFRLGPVLCLSDSSALRRSHAIVMTLRTNRFLHFRRIR